MTVFPVKRVSCTKNAPVPAPSKTTRQPYYNHIVVILTRVPRSVGRRSGRPTCILTGVVLAHVLLHHALVAEAQVHLAAVSSAHRVVIVRARGLARGLDGRRHRCRRAGRPQLVAGVGLLVAGRGAVDAHQSHGEACKKEFLIFFCFFGRARAVSRFYGAAAGNQADWSPTQTRSRYPIVSFAVSLTSVVVFKLWSS